MPLPFTIITVEMGFLFGALAVVAAFLVGSRLGKLWEPIFDVPGFESATRDHFWLAVDAPDPAFDSLSAGVTPNVRVNSTRWTVCSGEPNARANRLGTVRNWVGDDLVGILNAR